MTPLLRNLKRRLERWELQHLREHAAELAQRLEAAEQRAADAQYRLSLAEVLADSWREEALDMQRAAAADGGGKLGITMNGRLVVMPAAAGGLHA